MPPNHFPPSLLTGQFAAGTKTKQRFVGYSRTALAKRFGEIYSATRKSKVHRLTVASTPGGKGQI